MYCAIPVRDPGTEDPKCMLGSRAFGRPSDLRGHPSACARSFQRPISEVGLRHPLDRLAVVAAPGPINPVLHRQSPDAVLVGDRGARVRPDPELPAPALSEVGQGAGPRPKALGAHDAPVDYIDAHIPDRLRAQELGDALGPEPRVRQHKLARSGSRAREGLGGSGRPVALAPCRAQREACGKCCRRSCRGGAGR